MTELFIFVFNDTALNYVVNRPEMHMPLVYGSAMEIEYDYLRII